MISDIDCKGLTRKATLTITGDKVSNRFPASFSSETPVERRFGKEVLVHDSEYIDMSRVSDGGRLPLIAFHDQRQWPLGYVEGFHLDEKNKVTRGYIVFADTERTKEPLQLIRQNVPLEISIGYDINKDEVRYDEKNDTYYFKWTPAEVSVLPLGADSTIGFGRSLSLSGALPMSSDTPVVVPISPDIQPPSVDTSSIKNSLRSAEKAGAVKAIAGERQRISDIAELFSLSIIPQNDFYQSLQERAINEGWNIEDARRITLEVMAGECEPAMDYRATDDQMTGIRVATHEGRLPPVVIPAKPGNQARGLGSMGRVAAGEDALDKFKTGATHALLVRGGILNSSDDIAKAREGGIAGMSLSRMAEQYLRVMDIQTANLGDEEMAGRAFVTRATGMTTSDFTNILANVANKSLLQGWTEAPEVWQQWTRRGQLSDFKRAERAGLSGFSGLDEIPEDGEIKYGKMTDRKELIVLKEYAKKFRISRRTIINDDLNAFSNIPRLMGRAANRKIGDVVYALIDGVGPTLNQDSIALFDTSTHKNYVAAATAPTIATVTTTFTAMAKQTDPNTGSVMNIQPRFMLVPKALEISALTLLRATYDPAGTAGTLTPNPFQNRFEVISDARMDAGTNGATAWMMTADPNIYDTVEVAFLNGMAEPYIREQEEWDTRGVEYVVGIDFGVSVLDYRTMHKYCGS